MAIDSVRIKLLDLITAHFSEPELQELAFRLDIDYDDLSGTNRRTKALQLVLFCERMGRLPELVALGAAFRPGVGWPEVSQSRSERYKILEELGHGSFATVYKAHDERLDRPVALKILHNFWSQDAVFVDRFHQEAKRVASLNHPNIVTIYDRGELNGRLFIAMAYIDGRTLHDYLLEKGPLPLTEALPILQQITDALDHAHRRDLVHRDIKPGNIMVAETAEGLRVTVLDFGLAKAMESTVALTSVGELLGSPEYMAPEQADPNRLAEVGPAADRYALGIIAYHMLIGRVPFPGNTPATLHAHEYKPVPPPRSVNPGLPSPVAKALLKMLAKEPAKRYPTATAFVADLQQALVKLNQLSQQKEAQPIWRRLPTWSWAIGVVAVLLLLFLALRPPGTAQEVEGRPDSTATSEETAVITTGANDAGKTTITKGPIQLGQTVSGTVLLGESHLWYFSDGPAMIDVLLETQARANATLILFAPDDDYPLEYHDSLGEGRGGVAKFITIDDNSQYAILVDITGRPSSSYQLTVRLSEPQLIRPGDVVTGTVIGHNRDVWIFQEGSVTVNGTLTISGSGDPELMVFDTAGNALFYRAVAERTLHMEAFHFPDNGPYYITVRVLNSSLPDRPYTLTLTNLASPTPTPSPTSTQTSSPTSTPTPQPAVTQTIVRPTPLPTATSSQVAVELPVNVRVDWIVWGAGGYTDIFVVYADGRQVNLTNDTYRQNLAVLSPDRKKVAFEQVSSVGPAQIFVMNVDGTGRLQLTFGPYGNTRPTWSADGSEIFYTSWEDNRRYAVTMDGLHVRLVE
jgi:serine/threonine protein kinase